MQTLFLFNLLHFFRYPKTVDTSRSTTLKPLEVNDNVKIETRHAASKAVHLLEDSTYNLQDRSLCPWKYSIQTDSNRQPADLIEASCITYGIQGSARVCEPVFYYMQVKYKQTSSTGLPAWVDDWMKLSVGCTLSPPLPQRAFPSSEAVDPTLS